MYRTVPNRTRQASGVDSSGQSPGLCHERPAVSPDRFQKVIMSAIITLQAVGLSQGVTVLRPLAYSIPSITNGNRPRDRPSIDPALQADHTSRYSGAWQTAVRGSPRSHFLDDFNSRTSGVTCCPKARLKEITEKKAIQWRSGRRNFIVTEADPESAQWS